MKANEAPEKLWWSEGAVWHTNPNSIRYVEYIRTDAFVERAEKWLRNNQQGFILTDKDITDFVNYIKGE